MLNLEQLVGLKDKTVVITGAASGMAKVATELLLSLDAKVYAIDRNAVDAPVEKSIRGDLSRKDSIDDVVAQLPDDIDAAYLCAGVGLRPNWEKFIQMVNFVGTRYLAEALLPKMKDGSSITFISSTGGYGWPGNMKVVGQLLATPTFEDAEQWIDAHLDYFKQEDAPDPYQFSKQCLSAYVKAKCRSEEYIMLTVSFEPSARVKDASRTSYTVYGSSHFASKQIALMRSMRSSLFRRSMICLIMLSVFLETQPFTSFTAESLKGSL